MGLLVSQKEYAVPQVALQVVTSPTDDEGNSNDSLDLGASPERPKLIPPGIYEVGYRNCTAPFFSFNSRRTLSFFTIVTPDEFAGVVLYMGMRVSPRPGKKSMAATSKLVRMVTLATGKFPERFDRLNMLGFRNQTFLAKVVTVSKDSDHNPLGPEMQYSVIRVLLERTSK